jgi:hydroxypyruvate isomerase
VLFAANLSILWPELPLADRFERAARAGFAAVEVCWPGPRLNLLLGLRQERYSLGQQLACARDNVAWAADLAAEAGCEVMLEAINPMDNGPCLLTTTAAAASFAGRVARENVRLQYDVYHMQRMEGDLVSTLDAYWPLIGHIQIADVPGRHEPGTGEINYPFVLDHIERGGYQGAVGLEYRPSTGRAEDGFGWLAEYRGARDRRP